ncbi:hypothetical protein [uncultured Robinsoniella sp.]|uniref:hypothetical protein n=1 Tax=uncultured Robinsoniella sp. TaxID=904190 RepID=UPI00374F3C75
MQRQCTEREGGGPGEVFGRLNAELAFSNLAEALFGGTRAFTEKCIKKTPTHNTRKYELCLKAHISSDIVNQRL